MDKVHSLELQLKALGNFRRLEILVYLKWNKSAVVGEIADTLKVSLQAASQHLRILKSAHIVECRKRKSYVFYRISLSQVEPVKKVIALL